MITISSTREAEGEPRVAGEWSYVPDRQYREAGAEILGSATEAQAWGGDTTE
ncbi:MAG: hypothetical protein ACLPX9_01680 [Rhodomicrobium sp.]